MVRHRRVHIIQPVVPKYRVNFFERLGEALGDKLYIYCSSSWPGSPVSQDINVKNIIPDLKVSSWKGKLFFQSIKELVKNLNEGDVVVLSGNLRILSNFFVMAYCKVKSVKVIWWGHAWSPNSTVLTRVLRKGAMRYTDGVLLYTDAEKSKYTEVSYINKPLFALNNGIDVDEVDRHFKCDWSQYSGLGNVAVFCGRLTVKSNILLLLNAVRYSNNLERLIIVGDGELLEECCRLVDDYNFRDKVDILGAIYDPEKLAEVFSQASLFIYPGGVGLSIIHAMAHGLPVILHNKVEKHCPEYVVADVSNSMFFDDNNAISLANVVDLFFSYPLEVRTELAKSARRKVEGEFNTKSMALRFLDMLDYYEGK